MAVVCIVLLLVVMIIAMILLAMVVIVLPFSVKFGMFSVTMKCV